MQVRDVMTDNPFCVMPSEKLTVAARQMRDHDCGMLPVVQDTQSKRLVGVITDRDIVCRVVANDIECSRATVSDGMSSEQNWVVHPNDDIDRAITMMEDKRVRRLPVVDNQQNVVGIIALADIAKEVEDDTVVAEVLEVVSQPEHSPHA